jgi:TetR/AcrR family transcriptional regulator
LQEPGGDRVTTAALAARIQVSEAALYRHFASKAQMFEGLIEFIESTIFGLINKIANDETDGLRQLSATLKMLLNFAERNPGMTRVLIGDALVTEDARLQTRINQILDRIETSLKQSFRTAISQEKLAPNTEVADRSNVAMAFVMGRWLRYAKGGFKSTPSHLTEQQLTVLIT